MPDGYWLVRGAFVERILTSYFNISIVKPLCSSGKTLAANAGGRGFEFHRGNNLLVTFTIFRMEREELFRKTNIKLLKLIKI